MASIVGHIGPFNPDLEDWSMYAERIDFYFQANDIAGAEKKRATFLSLIGPETYKTLRSLLVPASPSDKTYGELKTVLDSHFCPKRSQIYYLSQFYRRTQKPGMSWQHIYHSFKH